MHACGTWFGCGSVNTVTEEFLDTRLYREAKGKEEGTAVEDERLEFRRMLLNTFILRPLLFAWPQRHQIRTEKEQAG